MTKPIPEGFHSLTPHIVVKDLENAIEWYKKAFDAKESYVMKAPDGSPLHAEVKIGNSPMMLAPENPEWESKGPTTLGGTPVTLHLYVDDVDAVFEKAKSAGAKVDMPPADQFWGDRYGKVRDPFGHQWGIATHREDVPPDEMGKRAEAWFASMQQGGGSEGS